MRLIYGFLFLGFFVTSSVSAQQKLVSGIYEWDKTPVEKTTFGESKIFFNRSSRSLLNFRVASITVNKGKSFYEKVPAGTDRLIIIREGKPEIIVSRENHTMGPGSIVVLSDGDPLSVRNISDSGVTLYIMDFKPAANEKQKKIPPVFVDWEKVEFKASANGGRRSIMQQPLSFLKELEIHVTTLKEGLPSHDAHVHPDEEIILMRKGSAEETIRGKPFLMNAGSFVFLTDDDLHGISNAGKGECEYYAIRWLCY